MTKFAFAIMLATLAFPIAADAAPGPVQAACVADAQTLCPNMAWPDQRKCLMDNSAKVSQDCGTAIANARSAMQVFTQACGADVKQYCGTIPVGPDRHKCVVANQAHFSQACQAALAPPQH